MIRCSYGISVDSEVSTSSVGSPEQNNVGLLFGKQHNNVACWCVWYLAEWGEYLVLHSSTIAPTPKKSKSLPVLPGRLIFRWVQQVQHHNVGVGNAQTNWCFSLFFHFKSSNFCTVVVVNQCTCAKGWGEKCYQQNIHIQNGTAERQRLQL